MKLYGLLHILLCFSSFVATGQEISDEYSIEIPSKNLPLSEPLVISVILRDVENRVPVIFPDIEGLEKQSKSATSAINTVEGKKVVIQTISQQYFSSKPGRYVIPDFTIVANGVKIHSEETVVIFSVAGSGGNDQVEASETALLPELSEIGRDIFLSVQVDKRSVFIREGFAIRLSLFVAENAPVNMEFYQFNRQLPAMLKTLRPPTCWEENVGLEEIARKRIAIGGREYTEYNMYTGQLFPLTLQDIIIPAVTLEMLVVSDGEADGEVVRALKPFTSKGLKIGVKPLPGHPLSDKVPVGQYNLIERLSTATVYPGESVRYVFKVVGKGNIKAIPDPEVLTNAAFDFYPPDVSQLIRRSDWSVTGEKEFDYFVVPRQEGKFPLARYFQWIYFDPVAARYDTLRPAKVLQVKGEDYRLGNVAFSSALSLYDNLEKLDSSRDTIDFRKILKNLTNAIVVILLAGIVWIFRK
jgi:hypothetical protein